MATPLTTYVPSGKATVQSVSATTAGTAVALGNFVKFIITASQAVMLVFYNSAGGSQTPSATVGMYVPANTPMAFDLSSFYNTINFYNTGASAATVSIQQFTEN